AIVRIRSDEQDQEGKVRLRRFLASGIVVRVPLRQRLRNDGVPSLRGPNRQTLRAAPGSRRQQPESSEKGRKKESSHPAIDSTGGFPFADCPSRASADLTASRCGYGAGGTYLAASSAETGRSQTKKSNRCAAGQPDALSLGSTGKHVEKSCRR